MDAKEFKELYFQHHPRVIRVAYYIIKDKYLSEDIAQEVFLKLWNKTDLNTIDSIEGYLVQMTKNVAFDFIESSKRESDKLIGLRDHQISMDDQPTAGTQHEELRKSLEKAVSQLSPQCRLIFSLSRFEGLTNEEIAEYLGISKRTVETQISAAFKRFRTDLKPMFITAIGLLLLLGLLA